MLEKDGFARVNLRDAGGKNEPVHTAQLPWAWAAASCHRSESHCPSCPSICPAW